MGALYEAVESRNQSDNSSPVFTQEGSPMGDSYIPATDAGALDWMQTFAAGISASAATYQLQAADAAAISSAVNAYAAASALAVDPNTRTPVNVSLKDQARSAAEAICRQYA